jgi:hypothetical protein
MFMLPIIELIFLGYAATNDIEHLSTAVLDGQLYGALIHVVAEDVEAHRARVEAAFREAGIEIRSMGIIVPSLEDVFIASVRDRGESRR